MVLLVLAYFLLQNKLIKFQTEHNFSIQKANRRISCFIFETAICTEFIYYKICFKSAYNKVHMISQLFQARGVH